MIAICAPYSPIGSENGANLGASRKIELVLQSMADIDQELVLVNSAHNQNGKNGFAVRAAEIGGVALTEISLPLSKNRTLGKFKNLFQVQTAVEKVLELGIPKLVWLYNGYGFESLFGRKMAIQCGVPVVLEMEDWHFSRRAGSSPKPYVDYVCYRAVLPHLKAAFAVNQHLKEKISNRSFAVELLPGLVPAELGLLNEASPPFQSNEINVAYCGGLSTEKGVDLVLAISELLADQVNFHITGMGPLEREVQAFADTHPRFNYYGSVSSNELYEVLGRCDVVLNPHSAISEMSNGVFPFKVIEGIVAGRYLISTRLPDVGLANVLAGVRIVEANANAFAEAILNSRTSYRKSREVITECASLALDRFGVKSLGEKIKCLVFED